MNEPQPSSTEWKDLDTDEIASIASDELHENRPNRWRGPKSTWRALTEEETTLWQSLKSIDDANLSAHLYNSFALKKRANDPATAQDLTAKTADGRQGVWAPPKLWTAWPLAEGHLPKEYLVARPDDDDEEYTFRNSEIRYSGSDLHDELGALLLRTAKRRFNKRAKKWANVRPSVESRTASPSGLQSRAAQGDGEDMDAESDKAEQDSEDGSSTEKPQTPSRSGERRYPDTSDPVFSADDDLSYSLLEPSVRHIMSRLDSTLQILHNTRAAKASLQSDSESDASSAAEQSADNSDSHYHNHQEKLRRERARKRKADDIPHTSEPLKTSNRGRPRKVNIPLEGESYQEMLDRVAREGHRRLPARPAEDDNAAFEEWIRQGEENIKREQSRRRETDEEQTANEEPGSRSGKRIWGLRDWSDVIGAASLAGFCPDVIARTTRRCANLFGQSMAVRTLQEVPAIQDGPTGASTDVYHPEPIHLSDSDLEIAAAVDQLSSEDEWPATPNTPNHRRTYSRQSSLAPFSSTSISPSARSRSRSRPPSRPTTPSRSRSQSRSRSASAGQYCHFCPVTTCERAGVGFSRKANLKRHVELVHGSGIPPSSSPGRGRSSTPGAASGAAMSEVDSEDETFGGVHVDGFLRPVVPSRGWRGEDMATRKRKRFYKDKRVKGCDKDGRATSDDSDGSSG